MNKMGIGLVQEKDRCRNRMGQDGTVVERDCGSEERI